MKFWRGFFIVFIILSLGCESTELRGTIGFISTDEDIIYFPGDIITLEGTFQNDAGLSSIKVFNEALNIDFVQKLEGDLFYDLYLERKLPALETPQVYNLQIQVTDTNSQIEIFTYPVDYGLYPTLKNLGFTLDETDNTRWFLNGFIEDPQGIRTLQLNSLRIGNLINKRFDDGITTFSLNEEFWYPSDAILGEYPLTLQIVNQRGFNLTITDFEEIFKDQ